MKRTLVFPLSGSAALLAIATVALPADARSVSASAGHSSWAANASCFSPLWESETNNSCAGAPSYSIPLVVDAAGTYSITVTAYGANPSSGVGCRAYGVNANHTVYSGGAITYLPSYGASVGIPLSASVPNGGALYVDCLVSQGGRIDTVDWLLQ